MCTHIKYFHNNNKKVLGITAFCVNSIFNLPFSSRLFTSLILSLAAATKHQAKHVKIVLCNIYMFHLEACVYVF